MSEMLQTVQDAEGEVLRGMRVSALLTLCRSVRRSTTVLSLVAVLGSRAVAYPPPPDELGAYEHCEFIDGLHIVEVSPLAEGVSSRTVETASGSQAIQLLGGRRVMFAYPNTDFFANVKVEQLPAETFARSKKALLDGLDFTMLSTPSCKRNLALQSPINGFEIHGFDRDRIEGGVLGMYLLIDDRNRLVTTIYLLNQDAAQRQFSNLSEYAMLRDRFLAAYTACIAAGWPR